MGQRIVKMEIENPAGWIQVTFTLLLAAIAWFCSLPRNRQLLANALAILGLAAFALEQYSNRRLNPLAAAVLRDWLPVLLLLFPYWQVGQFFTRADPVAEKRLARFDHRFFRTFGI